MQGKHHKLTPKLGQWQATAVAGNDILSSALYVSGIAILFAGIYAPLVFVIIAVVLYLYKSVYIEVVEALPLNGGAYNCLLNGTSKTIAACAGVITFITYIATAVISAKTAVAYVHTVLPLPITFGTLIVLGTFGLLTVSGIKDSAKVALAIFIFHIICLVLFIGLGVLYLIHGNSQFGVNMMHTDKLLPQQGGFFFALFFAFSAALIGATGFESSSNFVEQQKPGVFRKTLRNMLIAVGIFSPLLTLVILNTMDYNAISQAKDFLLADAARILGGTAFQYMIVLDAFLVLSGAVLTAYIAVSGLLSRMAAEGCLPYLLTKKNHNGAFPAIIVFFFSLCSSILLFTGGNLLTLAGVYALSFLTEMTLFAFGNLILKETRSELRRNYRAPVLFVVLAFFATFVGILGNVHIDSNNLRYFIFYFIPILIVVLCIIYQDYLLMGLLRVFRTLPFLRKPLQSQFREITHGRFVAFIHNKENIYKILRYINRNETGRHITLIHCKCDETCDDHKEAGSGMRELERIVTDLQLAGAFTHFKIDVVYSHTPFGPEAIDQISKELRIKRNRILIGSIHDSHPYDYASLGGLRVIF